MVPDKFNMVDMGGIDIIESQGIAVEGLYQKLVESIAQCRYQVLYNWYFNGIQIAPSYVEMTVDEDSGDVLINEGVSVTSGDVIYIHSLEYDIQELEVTENGTYTATGTIAGYSPVQVNIEPVVETLTVTENGTYDVPEGVDGYSQVVVNVPTIEASPITLTKSTYNRYNGTLTETDENVYSIIFSSITGTSGYVEYAAFDTGNSNYKEMEFDIDGNWMNYFSYGSYIYAYFSSSAAYSTSGTAMNAAGHYTVKGSGRYLCFSFGYINDSATINCDITDLSGFYII